MRRFFESPPPPFILPYIPDEHEEARLHLTTGLVGALLRLKLPSLSGPEIGSPLPIVVTHVPGDLIRIFVDPKIKTYKKEGREFVRLTALAHTGEAMSLDTYYIEEYIPHRALEAQLKYQAKLLSTVHQEP